MGQAQRTGSSHRSNARNNISLIYGDEPRSRSMAGKKPRNGGGSRTGNASRSGRREGAGRRHTNRDLQDLEMWEISRESDNPRLMRLAEREPVRPRKRRSANAVRRRKAKRRKELLCRCFMLLVIAVCLVLIFQTAGAVYRIMHDGVIRGGEGTGKGIVEVMSDKSDGNKIEPPAITEDFLEINDYSRPGTALKKVNSVFVHYTANPGTSAKQNRSYFANLAQTHERSASAHFIIGCDGEVIQCIPREEQAHAVISRNEDSLSIECCYQDEDGKFTQETYDTLVHMLAWLTQEYHLTTDDILRHYDCGGKLCPLYYVEHEDAWEQLLADVDSYIAENGQ